MVKYRNILQLNVDMTRNELVVDRRTVSDYSPVYLGECSGDCTGPQVPVSALTAN